MTTDALHLKRIEAMVEPIQKKCGSLVELAESPGRSVQLMGLLLYLAFMTKRASTHAEDVIVDLGKLDTMAQWGLDLARKHASTLDLSSSMSCVCASSCRSVLETRTHRQFASAFLLRMLSEDLERLAIRLEDLAETLALSVSKPFADFVQKELDAHA